MFPLLSQNNLSVPEQVFIPAVSHMKSANVHIGTIHWNVNIALQFLYQFAVFISDCNFHISLQFSRFGVVLTWTFAICIWVCNVHISLQFSYQLQFSRHDSSTYHTFNSNRQLEREQRNHVLKYESECVSIGIGIKYESWKHHLPKT